MRNGNYMTNVRRAKVESFIKRAYSLAENSPINIRLDTFEPDEAYVAWIERDGGNPGDGRKYLETICEYADQMGVIICLTISPRMRKLLSYYESFGFVQDGPETSEGIHMYRHYKADD